MQVYLYWRKEFYAYVFDQKEFFSLSLIRIIEKSKRFPLLAFSEVRHLLWC